MLTNFEHSSIKNQSDPFYIFYPENLSKRINYFKKKFKGTILYAVKANPSEFIIKSLKKNGVKYLDVASINEIRLVKKIFPEANLYFMNPVKSRNSIRKAYSFYKVRNFAVDTFDELDKIYEETNFAKDLNIFMRLKIPNNYSIIKLSNKFGISEKNAPSLLKKIDMISSKVGICFHVGSQCTDPNAFNIAFSLSKKVLKESGVKISYLNVGGGFPQNLREQKVQKISNYLNLINKNFSKFLKNSDEKINLFSEPGRSIVSDCLSLVVKVNLRKKNKLYINDGIHGYLNNAGYLNFTYPVKIFNRKKVGSEIKPFSFFGPTCDSNDFMKGPFFLPDSIREGDWIEIKNIGAYSMTMKTDFNGLNARLRVFKSQN